MCRRKSDGTRRCAFAEDWDINAEENLPAPAAKGYGGTLASPTGAGYCGGVELEAGDRLVAEVGYRCTAQSAAPVEGSIWRGGTGPALSLGANPDAGAHGRPGYLQIDGGLRFTATGAAPDPCGNGAIVTPPSRILQSVTTTSDNAISAATLADPQGNPRSYTYTTNGTGALATKTETSTSATTTYTYDTYGNLRAVELPGGTDIAYRIDATNRRVGKEVNGTPVQGFLYQSALRPVAELDASNNVVSFFVYAEKPNVPEYMVKGGSTYRIITDHLGSVRLVVDTSTGDIAQRLDYDHHGNVTRDTNPGFQPFGWAGGLYDPDTGLIRFGARDYDPEVGRWTAPDPSGFDGGDGNLYAYAFNDTANYVDSEGEAATAAAVAAGGSLVTLPAWLNPLGLGIGYFSAGYWAGSLIEEQLPANVFEYWFPHTDTGEAIPSGIITHLKGGESPKAKEGRERHKQFDEQVAGKPGWQVRPRLVDPATGKTVIPDALTPSGRPVELKPDSPSGRASGKRAIKKYERATGKRGRVVYWR